ncbi:MAG TPA: sugar phosphate isomerase/epimerase family protein [Gaiellaceae bacterium]|nr:sugar phosphate isomerase/epimerase family protein [Gaiellaceae bacterium]
MRIGICQWTTFPAPFEDELAACRAAGAGAIGILEFKLEGVDDVRGKLRDSGLAVSACLPAAGSILPSPLIPGPDEPEQRVESICASVARLAELEPGCVFFLTGPGDDRAALVEGIGRIAEAGRRHGVPVALEPIHPSQAGVLSPVSTVEEALELIGDADVGIMFDTWHLAEVSHVERILGVHVADRTRPETRSDMDRALPGDDSRAAVRALVEGGYDGWFDVEVMSDDGTFGDAFPDSLWALPVDEIARRAVAAMEAL